MPLIDIGLPHEAPRARSVVGPGRLELPTLRLSGVRSNHLSYGPSGSRQGAGSSPGRTLRTIMFATLTREYVACEERETKAAKFRMLTPDFGVFCSNENPIEASL